MQGLSLNKCLMMDCKYSLSGREGIICEDSLVPRKRKSKRKHGASRVMEIGKVLAETSRGLFSPDDWQCSKCANVNWARRQRCNICNAPKYSKQEERTGIGGGYDDRGVVEYVKRDESDGEYDHFGRRKKKQNGREDVHLGSMGKIHKDSDDEDPCMKDDEQSDDEGGYDDRSVVESVKRHESDEECDNLGRKKKQKGWEEDDSNQKEEQSEDEVDLSMYDLSEWDKS